MYNQQGYEYGQQTASSQPTVAYYPLASNQWQIQYQPENQLYYGLDIPYRPISNPQQWQLQSEHPNHLQNRNAGGYQEASPWNFHQQQQEQYEGHFPFYQAHATSVDQSGAPGNGNNSPKSVSQLSSGSHPMPTPSTFYPQQWQFHSASKSAHNGGYHQYRNSTRSFNQPLLQQLCQIKVQQSSPTSNIHQLTNPANPGYDQQSPNQQVAHQYQTTPQYQCRQQDTSNQPNINVQVGNNLQSQLDASNHENHMNRNNEEQLHPAPSAKDDATDQGNSLFTLINDQTPEKTRTSTDLQNFLDSNGDKDIGEKLLKCPIGPCPFRTKWYISLQRHVETCNTKTFSCSKCPYSTNYRFRFTAHVKAHLAPQMFSCELCHFKSIQKCFMVKHISNTHPNMPDSSYTTVKNKETDSALLPVELQDSRLVDALKDITDIPLQCPMCSYWTYNQRNMWKHEKRHDKNFSCTKCPFSTNEERQFESHAKAHLAARMFSCNHCHFKNTSKYFMANHLAKKHPTTQDSSYTIIINKETAAGSAASGPPAQVQKMAET